jgi:exodeoxyribonuclease V beta subunit
MLQNFTPESHNLEENLFLKASAGTGKTYSIEHLVLRWLVEKETPLEKIVLLTFTKKAGRELKLRLSKKIREILHHPNPEKIKWIDEFHCHPPSDIKNIKIHLQKCLDHMEKSMIGTIHSFCQRLLNMYPNVGKLSSDFKILSDDEWRRRYLSELNHLAVCNSIQSEELAEFTSPPFSNESVWVHGMKLENIPKEDISEEAIKKQLKIIIESIKNITIPKEIANSFNKKTWNTFDKFIKSLPEDSTPLKYSVKTISEETFIKNLKSDERKCLSLNKISNKELESRVIQFRNELIQKSKEILLILQKVSELKLKSSQEIYEKIVLESMVNIEKTFLKDGFLTQNHLIKRVHLLRKEFSEIFQNSYELLILDEFQDTDSTQWEIFSEFASQKVKFYVVGDPKQSIYQFRGADVYAYAKAETHTLFQNRSKSLIENRRTGIALGIQLNELFQKWFQDSNEGIISFYDSKYIKEDPSFYFTLNESDDFNFAKKISEIIREDELFSKGSIAILTTSNSSSKTIANTLSKLGIPWKFKSLPWMESREVAETTILLESIHFKDSLKKIQITRFWDPSIPFQKESWISKLEEDAENKNWISFFSTLVENSHLKTRLKNDPDRVGTMQSFQDVWIEMEKVATERSMSLYELLQWIKEKISLLFLEESIEDTENTTPREENVVQIMTIHASKGLEFDSVFVSEFRLRNDFDPYVLIHDSKSGKNIYARKSIEENLQLAKNQELSEKLRLFYVAYTRAKSNLYIQVSQKNESRYHRLNPWQPQSLFSLASNSLDPKFNLPIELPSIQKDSQTFIHRGLHLKSFSSLHKTTIQTEDIKIDEGEDIEIPQESGEATDLPMGVQFGTTIHTLMEILDFSLIAECLDWNEFMEKDQDMANRFLRELNSLYQYRSAKSEEERISLQEKIYQMIFQTLTFPLPEIQVPLSKIPKSNLYKEESFIFSLYRQPHYFMNGAIDLIFEHSGKYYVLDWKTNNLLKDGVTNSPMKKKVYNIMSNENTQDGKGHNYNLQGKIYMLALYQFLRSRGIKDPLEKMGGAFFLFIRHLNFQEEAISFIQPMKNSEEYEDLEKYLKNNIDQKNKRESL